MTYELTISRLRKNELVKCREHIHVGNWRYGNSRYIMSSQTAWQKLMGLSIFLQKQTFVDSEIKYLELAILLINLTCQKKRE